MYNVIVTSEPFVTYADEYVRQQAIIPMKSSILFTYDTFLLKIGKKIDLNTNDTEKDTCINENTGTARFSQHDSLFNLGLD